MNGSFFQNPNFYDEKEGSKVNYFILKDNLNKKVNVFTTYKTDEKSFSGILEEYLDDNLIVSCPSTGNWYLIPLKFIYYIEFEEKISF